MANRGLRICYTIKCVFLPKNAPKVLLEVCLCPDPLGILQHSPRPSNWIKERQEGVEGMARESVECG